MAMAFDPFRELDRLFGSDYSSGSAPRAMPMDLYREGDHYVLAADMPGVEPASVDVGVDGQQLTIRATRTTRNPDDAQWLVKERGSGEFLRQLTLGDGLDVDKIAATYENGVLTVTIPVSESAKPRKIEVVAGNTVEQIPATAKDASVSA